MNQANVLSLMISHRCLRLITHPLHPCLSSILIINSTSLTDLLLSLHQLIHTFHPLEDSLLSLFPTSLVILHYQLFQLAWLMESLVTSETAATELLTASTSMLLELLSDVIQGGLIVIGKLLVPVGTHLLLLSRSSSLNTSLLQLAPASPTAHWSLLFLTLL